MGLKSINSKKNYPQTQEHSLERLPDPISPEIKKEDNGPVETEDPLSKDEFLMTKAMRTAISQKYKIVQVIGKGSYGCVSKAKCLETGVIVALKVMQNKSSTEYEFIKLLREIKIMRGLDEILSDSFTENPFVPRLLDIICPSLTSSSKLADVNLSQICLVIEFIDTDLDQLLKHKIDFSEYHMIKIVYNTLCSLSYLHAVNIIHRDIKPANILIS